MTEEKFWENIGNFAEFADAPCNECVVRKYCLEHPEYNHLCEKSCKEAILDVYKQIVK